MMYDSSACMLRMITPGGRSSFCARAATSMPFSFGIADIEDDARPGRCSSHSRTASRPSAASATTVDARLFEQTPQPAPDDAVIVSQQHAQAASSVVAAGNGRWIASVVPRPARLPIVIVPCSSFTRSSMPRSPRPLRRVAPGSRPTPSSVTDTSQLIVMAD